MSSPLSELDRRVLKVIYAGLRSKEGIPPSPLLAAYRLRASDARVKESFAELERYGFIVRVPWQPHLTRLTAKGIEAMEERP